MPVTMIDLTGEVSTACGDVLQAEWREFDESNGMLVIGSIAEMDRLALSDAEFADFVRRHPPRQEWLDRDETKPF